MFFHICWNLKNALKVTKLAPDTGGWQIFWSVFYHKLFTIFYPLDWCSYLKFVILEMFKFGSERIVQSIEVFIEAEMQKKDAEVKKKAAFLCLNDLASVDDPLMDWFTNHVCRFLAASEASLFQFTSLLSRCGKFPSRFIWRITLPTAHSHGHLFQLHPLKRQELDLVFCFNMFHLKESNDPSSPGYRGSNEECWAREAKSRNEEERRGIWVTSLQGVDDFLRNPINDFGTRPIERSGKTKTCQS